MLIYDHPTFRFNFRPRAFFFVFTQILILIVIFSLAFIGIVSDAPIFVYIHGGYWQALDKTSSAYVVEPLYRAGHKVIVLDYDLCPTVTLEQLVDQVQRAGISIINYATSMGTK